MRSIATGFSPKLGQDLTMTAAATPRGRPQYAAQRDEIAPSASGDRCRSALEPGLPVATCMVRALAEMDQTTHVVRSISYSSSRARGLIELRSRAGPPTNKVERTPTKAPTGPRGELAKLRIAGAFGQETFSARATPISQRKTTKTALPSNTRPQNKKTGRRKSIYTSPPQFLLRVVDRRYPPTPPARSLPPGKHRRKFRSRCRSTRR